MAGALKRRQLTRRRSSVTNHPRIRMKNSARLAFRWSLYVWATQQGGLNNSDTRRQDTDDRRFPETGSVRGEIKISLVRRVRHKSCLLGSVLSLNRHGEANKRLQREERMLSPPLNHVCDLARRADSAPLHSLRMSCFDLIRWCAVWFIQQMNT